MAPVSLKLGFGLLALGLWVSPAPAAESISKILTPVDGAQLEAKRTYPLEYEVKALEKADHVHLFVDGEQTGMTHRLKGNFNLGPLAPGERKVCIKLVNKNHTPIADSENCITVTVQ